MFHVIDKNVDLGYLQSGCLLNGIANLVDNALDDSGDVDSVGHSDVQVDDQTARYGANLDALVLCLIFFERTLKLVDSCKHLALNRFLKKGPLGEHLHEENTDDEYGTTYADVDAETDYIKRPRHDKPGMDFQGNWVNIYYLDLPLL